MGLGCASCLVLETERPTRRVYRRLTTDGPLADCCHDAGHEGRHEHYARGPADDSCRCVEEGEPGCERNGEDQAPRQDEGRCTREPAQRQGRLAWANAAYRCNVRGRFSSAVRRDRAALRRLRTPDQLPSHRVAARSDRARVRRRRLDVRRVRRTGRRSRWPVCFLPRFPRGFQHHEQVVLAAASGALYRGTPEWVEARRGVSGTGDVCRGRSGLSAAARVAPLSGVGYKLTEAL